MKKFYSLIQAFFVTVLAIGVLTAFNSAFADDGDDKKKGMMEDEAFDAMMKNDEEDMMGDEGAMMDEDDFEKEGFKEMRKKMKEETGEHFKKFDLEGEIAFIEEQLGILKSVFESLKDVDDEWLQSAIKKLSALADEGMKLLTKMKEIIVDGKVTDEELIEQSWEMMDKLGEEAREYMEVLREYFEENKDELEALSEEQREGLMQMMEEEGEGHGRGRGDMGMDFEKLYEGFDLKGLDKAEFMKGIKEEMLDKVMRKVSGMLMEKLVSYLEEEVIADILNNLDFLDEDILTNSVLAYEEADGIDGMDKDFQKMRKMMKEMVIDEEVAKKLKAKWSEVKDAVDKKDKESLKSLKEEIKKLLEENRETVFRGEDAFLFEDLPLDHWSMEYVFELREEGVVDGYRDKEGNLLGEYGPSDNVTIAELLKMAIEAGVPVYEFMGSEGSVVDDDMHWAEVMGYVEYAKGVGVDKLIDLSDLNKAATREEAAIIIAKIFGYDTEREWRDAFADYKGKFKGYVQAVYDEGVFTGQGETGEFDGESNLNRAEVAKVIRAASEDQGFVMDMNEFIERLGKL
ncbi:S-layer homology domain-containing protein [Candidatus Peregrinibacteria bacterium]|nr:S-layer homology domain-containing protein [Candidatus Peregrinibacteria bacterium]